MASHSTSYRLPEDAHNILLKRAAAAGLSKTKYTEQIMSSHLLEDEQDSQLFHEVKAVRDQFEQLFDDVVQIRREQESLRKVQKSHAEAVITGLVKLQDAEPRNQSQTPDAENLISRGDLGRALFTLLKHLRPAAYEKKPQQEWIAMAASMADAAVPKKTRRSAPPEK